MLPLDEVLGLSWACPGSQGCSHRAGAAACVPLPHPQSCLERLWGARTNWAGTPAETWLYPIPLSGLTQGSRGGLGRGELGVGSPPCSSPAAAQSGCP